MHVFIVTLGCPSVRGGHRVAAGIAEMIVKNSSLGITRISVLKNVGMDQQHGSARWSCACQRAAQSPRGGVLTVQAAHGTIIFFIHRAAVQATCTPRSPASALGQAGHSS